MQESNQYIPGTCNIGKEEIRLRKNTTISMAILSIALIILFVLLDVDKVWRLTLFLPFIGFSIGAIQWHNRFCVYFGIKGVFNFEKRGTESNVIEEELRRLDISKARRMIAIALSFSIALTAGMYFLPM